MSLPPWHEEAIARSHDRKGFDCGDDDMNAFLQRFARQGHEQNAVKTFCAIADDTPFGLTSGICTTSLKHATHFKRNSQAGMVMVNLPTAGVDFHVPFGGRKGSSYGPREQGRYAAEFYTTVKTAYSFAG